MTYIEDYLEYVCNTHLDSLKSNNAIYFSIYKQTVRGIALTDRQYNLVVKKVKEFVDISDNIEPKIPLRQIDRKKYIKIVDDLGPGSVYESFKSDWKWIKIRFPFSKKHIMRIDKLRYQIGYKQYYHVKGSHEHYFRLDKDNVYQIVECFKNFEIDDTVLTIYKEQKIIKENLFNYIPFLSAENQLCNIEYTSTKNYVQNADNAIRYSYAITQRPIQNLTDKIAFRDNQLLYINPEENSVQDIFKSLNELNRYPIIVLVDEDNMFEQVKCIYEATVGFVKNKEQSVLFRADNTNIKNMPLNDYVKQKQLNNWVDNKTKVVYIKKTKLPKILLKSNFKPVCALSLTSMRSNKFVSTFCVYNCDCYIMVDNMENMFFKGYNLANLQTYN